MKINRIARARKVSSDLQSVAASFEGRMVRVRVELLLDLEHQVARKIVDGDPTMVEGLMSGLIDGKLGEEAAVELIDATLVPLAETLMPRPIPGKQNIRVITQHDDGSLGVFTLRNKGQDVVDAFEDLVEENMGPRRRMEQAGNDVDYVLTEIEDGEGDE